MLKEFIQLHAKFVVSPKEEKEGLLGMALAAGYEIDKFQLDSAYANAKYTRDRKADKVVNLLPRPLWPLPISLEVIAGKARRTRLLLQTSNRLRGALQQVREQESVLLDLLEEAGDDRFDWVFSVIQENIHLRQEVISLKAQLKKTKG